jgi:hypothetical protein
MNELLNKAERWLAELGIRTIARPTCLMVNRDDVTTLGDSNELLKELRSALGTNKFYWASFDDNHYYLDVW